MFIENGVQQTKYKMRKTTEERQAIIDSKIQYHDDQIKKLKLRKSKLKDSNKVTYNKVLKALKKSGLSPEEMLQMIEG